MSMYTVNHVPSTTVDPESLPSQHDIMIHAEDVTPNDVIFSKTYHSYALRAGNMMFRNAQIALYDFIYERVMPTELINFTDFEFEVDPNLPEPLKKKLWRDQLYIYTTFNIGRFLYESSNPLEFKTLSERDAKVKIKDKNWTYQRRREKEKEDEQHDQRKETPVEVTYSNKNTGSMAVNHSNDIGTNKKLGTINGSCETSPKKKGRSRQRNKRKNSPKEKVMDDIEITESMTVNEDLGSVKEHLEISPKKEVILRRSSARILSIRNSKIKNKANKSTNSPKSTNDMSTDKESDEETPMTKACSITYSSSPSSPSSSIGKKVSIFSRHTPEIDRTCPYCGRVLPIVTGLAYHIEHRVCQAIKSHMLTPNEVTSGKGKLKKWDRVKRKIQDIKDKTVDTSTETSTTTNINACRKRKKSDDDSDYICDDSSYDKVGNQAVKVVSRNGICGINPVPILKPGSKFVTKFGIVEIVRDDRIPCYNNFSEAKVESDLKKLRGRNRSALLRKERALNSARKRRSYTAKCSRRRRYNLMQMYLRGSNINNENNRNKDDDTLIMNQMNVWREYCKIPSCNPSSLLFGLYSHKRDEDVLILSPTQREQKKIWIEQIQMERNKEKDDDNTGDKDDPTRPRNSYPYRIVECILLNGGADERERVSGRSVMRYQFTRLSFAKKSTKKAKIEIAKAKKISVVRSSVVNSETNGKEDVDEELIITTQSSLTQYPTISMKKEQNKKKIYLGRHLLIHEYNKNAPKYTCIQCGRSMTSSLGLKHHVDEKVCNRRSQKIKIARDSRIKEIHKEAIVDMHEEIKVPYLIQLARKRLSFKPSSSSSSPRTCTLEGGRIRVNLRNNTVYPAWMKFYPDRSPWFPEVCTCLNICV